MTDVFFKIELFIIDPVLVSSAEQLLQLHPSQIESVVVRLGAGSLGGLELSLRCECQRESIQDLVQFAQGVQPEGTTVRVWYLGRSEVFEI